VAHIPIETQAKRVRNNFFAINLHLQTLKIHAEFCALCLSLALYDLVLGHRVSYYLGLYIRVCNRTAILRISFELRR
jgi:hypothetical protein